MHADRELCSIDATSRRLPDRVSRRGGTPVHVRSPCLPIGSRAIPAAVGESLVTWAPIVLGLGVLMLGVERWAPGRAWPRVSGWWIRAVALNLVQAGIVWLAGVAW